MSSAVISSLSKPIIVCIAGGTASGKTTVCDLIFEGIGGLKECTMLPMDCFYKELTDEEFKDVGKYNFDHPDAFDWDLLKETLAKLSRHEDVVIPNYNYKSCKRDPPGINLRCTDLVLFEGIFALFDPSIRDTVCDLKIFVHSDDDIRLLRRLKRDVIHRGRTIEGVIKSYNRFVKAAYDEYIKPTMKHSDIIVPRGAENNIAIQFITENLKNRLRDRGYQSPQTVFESLPFNPADECNKSVVLEAENRSIVDNIMLKMINQSDHDMLPMHVQYLTKQLWQLFKRHNEGYNDKEWEFVNVSPSSWSSVYDLNLCLETMKDPRACKHLCLFIPELVSKHHVAYEKIYSMLEIIRQYSFVHGIERIHIITTFMSDALPAYLKEKKLANLDEVTFYALAASKDLLKHPCFRHKHCPSEAAKEMVEEIDMTSQSAEMKINAFGQHIAMDTNGEMDEKLYFESFYACL